MFDKILFAFNDWYTKHSTAITWFVIGVLTDAVIANLFAGRFGWALVGAALIALNYYSQPKV